MKSLPFHIYLKTDKRTPFERSLSAQFNWIHSVKSYEIIGSNPVEVTEFFSDLFAIA